MDSIGSLRCPHCEQPFRVYGAHGDKVVVPVVQRLRRAHLMDDVEAVEEITKVTRASFCSRKKEAHIVEARHMLWRRIRERGYSYPRIAKLFDVDHTTVLAAIKGPRGR